MNPLVTVVTATWGRPRTILERAIPSVQAQTYQPIQHIVVTDGDDADLSATLRGAGYGETNRQRRLVQLGQNWGRLVVNGAVGAAPRQVGAFMAAGDYIAYLDDDDEWLPHHVANVVEGFATGVDLVCSKWCSPGGYAVYGSAPPRVGHTGTGMMAHRAELLKLSGWQMDGYECDGKLVERWIDGGASWVLLDEPTVIFYGAHFGAPESP